MYEKSNTLKKFHLQQQYSEALIFSGKYGLCFLRIYSLKEI